MCEVGKKIADYTWPSLWSIEEVLTRSAQGSMLFRKARRLEVLSCEQCHE